jgi:hypothetical protein
LVSGCLNRMLSKHNLRGISIPPKKVCDWLRLVKDDLGLKIPGVYCIPCECRGCNIFWSVWPYYWDESKKT